MSGHFRFIATVDLKVSTHHDGGNLSKDHRVRLHPLHPLTEILTLSLMLFSYLPLLWKCTQNVTSTLFQLITNTLPVMTKFCYLPMVNSLNELAK